MNLHNKQGQEINNATAWLYILKTFLFFTPYTMTKKHFQQFAELFKEIKAKSYTKTKDGQQVFVNLCAGFCDIARADNANFNQEKFIEAVNKDN